MTLYFFMRIIILTTISHAIYATYISHPNPMNMDARKEALSNILWRNFIRTVDDINPEDTQPIRITSGLWARSICPLLQKKNAQKILLNKEIMQLVNQSDSIKTELKFLESSCSNWNEYLSILHESSNENDALEKLYTLIHTVWSLPENQEKHYLNMIEESFKEIDLSSIRFLKNIKTPINQFSEHSPLAQKYACYTTFVPKPSLTLYSKTKTSVAPHSLTQQIETVTSALKELDIQKKELCDEQEKLIQKISQTIKGLT